MVRLVVSKAEGRYVRLADVVPSDEAARIAKRDGRDARLVEVVLRESNEVVSASERALIVEHRSGAVCAPAPCGAASPDSVNDSNTMKTDRIKIIPSILPPAE